MAQRERHDQDRDQGQERDRGSAEHTRPGRGARRPDGQVDDDRVKLGVGLGCEDTVEALLQLVSIQPPGEVLLAKELSHRLTVGVGGPQASILWPVVFEHRKFLHRFAHPGILL